MNYNNQDDYKEDDDGDDDEEDKDACVKSSCSLNEVPEPSVARPLMLFLVMRMMMAIAMMAVVVVVDNDHDDDKVEKDEYCLTQEKRRGLSLAKSLEEVEHNQSLEQEDCGKTRLPSASLSKWFLYTRSTPELLAS